MTIGPPDPDGECRDISATTTGNATRTVDVISAEQTSQTYFTPPSPPLAAIFFRITPMMSDLTYRKCQIRDGRGCESWVGFPRRD